MRNVAAALAGLVTAFLLIYLVELLGHTIYPPPEGLDFKDSDAMRAYISTLPVPALMFPMFAYFIGTFGGALLASKIAYARAIVFAAIVGIFVLAGTVANLIVIPHPLWFSILAVVGIIVSAWLATVLAPARSATED